MIAMTFDLSSTCIGVTFAQLKGHKIQYVDTLAIIPQPPTGLDFGYTTKEPKKLMSSRGKNYKAFLKNGEVFISQTEAEQREQEFKTAKHNYLLRNIGLQCGKYLNKIKPDTVAIEKNKSFNGILTTKLLAEIAGGIYFYCGAHGITMYDWDEATIRAHLRRHVRDFSLWGNEGKEIAVDTKWEVFCRLRAYFEQEHGIGIDAGKMTMDESDSLAVFYYLYETKIKQEG